MIKLKKESLELLKNCLQKYNPNYISIIENPTNNEYPSDFYNQLRQIVGDEFAVNGLNKDDEPSEYGIKLENLIDEIGRLFF